MKLPTYVLGEKAKFVKESDIKKLPIYKLWKQKQICTFPIIKDNEKYIPLYEWESFCNNFIKKDEK